MNSRRPEDRAFCVAMCFKSWRASSHRNALLQALIAWSPSCSVSVFICLHLCSSVPQCLPRVSHLDLETKHPTELKQIVSVWILARYIAAMSWSTSEKEGWTWRIHTILSRRFYCFLGVITLSFKMFKILVLILFDFCIFGDFSDPVDALCGRSAPCHWDPEVQAATAAV